MIVIIIDFGLLIKCSVLFGFSGNFVPLISLLLYYCIFLVPYFVKVVTAVGLVIHGVAELVCQ